MIAPQITAFFDEATNTVSYLVVDSETKVAAIIDPVLDFDAASGAISTQSADTILDQTNEAGLTIAWILETHAHADHLSAGHYLRGRTGARLGIGSHIDKTQATFAPKFGVEDVKPDTQDFDAVFADGQNVPLGSQTFEVLHVPGHTPADVAYRIGDAVFVGDTLFMPDYGTARTDFPGGDARTLYHSIRRLLTLPAETRLFMCHDYKAPGREEYRWETTVADQRANNIHVHDGVSEDEFVTMREARDATLSAPKLLLPSIQVNIRGGRLSAPAANGETYLVLPLRLPKNAEGALR